MSLNLNRLRLIAIVAPVAFLAAVEALSIGALRLVIPNQIVRLVVIFAILSIGAIPFAVWVFRLIERQQRDLAQASILVDSVADHAIFMLDCDGRVTTWSPGAEQVTGYAATDMIGQRFETLYPADEIDAGVPRGLLAKQGSWNTRAGRSARAEIASGEM